MRPTRASPYYPRALIPVRAASRSPSFCARNSLSSWSSFSLFSRAFCSLVDSFFLVEPQRLAAHTPLLSDAASSSFFFFHSASSSVMRAASASSSATRASSASSASILPCSAAAASSASSAIRSSSSFAVFSLYMRSYSSRSFLSHLSRTLFSVGVSFLDVGLTVPPPKVLNILMIFDSFFSFFLSAGG
jgi:hypothetical protein